MKDADIEKLERIRKMLESGTFGDPTPEPEVMEREDDFDSFRSWTGED
jgi:hypothetical protein